MHRKEELESRVVNVGFVCTECDVKHCCMVIETLSKVMSRLQRKEELEYRAMNVELVCNEYDIRHCYMVIEALLFLKKL